MNERQAIKNGYIYHGAYSRDKDEMMQQAIELRAQGNKAVVVNNGTGYSIYWIESEENIQKRRRAAAERKKEQLMLEQEKLILRLSEITEELKTL